MIISSLLFYLLHILWYFRFPRKERGLYDLPARLFLPFTTSPWVGHPGEAKQGCARCQRRGIASDDDYDNDDFRDDDDDDDNDDAWLIRWHRESVVVARTAVLLLRPG